jgi:outer membrane receptor protein involved in Fe transport
LTYRPIDLFFWRLHLMGAIFYMVFTGKKHFLIFVILLLVILGFSFSAQAQEETDKIYVMEPIEIKGNRILDLITNPFLESTGLELSTTTINQAEIERQGSKTLTDAMQYVPGAWIETRGRKVKQFFSVRGQKYPYPEYALDGAWQREFYELPYFFSSADIEKIEIIRSSAALLTGLSGLAGVINIIPKEYIKPETTSEVEYGTFDTYRFHISHGATVGKTSYAVGLGSYHTDGLKDKYAVENISNFYGDIKWRPVNTLTIKTELFQLYGMRELAKAEPPADPSLQNALEKFDPTNTTMFNLKTDFHPNSKANTSLLMYYSNRDDTFVTETKTPYTVSNELDFEWGANLIQSLLISNSNVLRFGGLYNHWVAPNGKRFYVGRRCDLETFSAVMVDEQQLGKLNINAGLRWYKNYIKDYGAFNIEGTAGKFKDVAQIEDQWEPSVFSGSFGIAYHVLRNLSLNLNLASGYIQPRFGTLDMNLEIPKNERRIKLDSGFRVVSNKIGSISLVGFVTQQKDAITLSGNTKEINGRIMELYMNQKKDQIGLELDTQSVPILGIAEPFLNLTAMRSRSESEGEMKRDETTPQFILNSGIYMSKSSIDFNFLWKYVSSYENTRFLPTIKGQPLVPEQLGKFHCLNAIIGWSFGKKHQTRAYIEIQNLLDKKFSTVVGYPDFGRAITVGIKSAV